MFRCDSLASQSCESFSLFDGRHDLLIFHAFFELPLPNFGLLRLFDRCAILDEFGDGLHVLPSYGFSQRSFCVVVSRVNKGAKGEEKRDGGVSERGGGRWWGNGREEERKLGSLSGIKCR